MKMVMALRVIAVFAWALWCAATAATTDPVSESGLDYYSQGGVVVDGVAYFTANDSSRRKGVKTSDAFPRVVAFDVNTFCKLRTYPFAKTYDSSPLVFRKKDGTWLIVAHEHTKERTAAYNRDTGKLEWTSAANQPGLLFFGYSYYKRDDGSKLIFAACRNGLHAMSGETGRDVWHVKQTSRGGITPCVDQQRGWVFYQCDGKLLKIRAADGEVLKAIDVPSPNRCVSWNTVLVNDSHGYFVATRWYTLNSSWASAIRVYDQNLNLAWERTDLASGKKATLTYADGKLVCGAGNIWGGKYDADGEWIRPDWDHYGKNDNWKHVIAYSITDGKVVWNCNLSKYKYTCILNVPYYNGFFYAETQDTGLATSKLFRINGANGKLEEILEYGHPNVSCAPSILAHGKMFSGELWKDRIVVTRIAENSKADWPGPFGDPQTNTYASPDEEAAVPTPMKEIRGTRNLHAFQTEEVRGPLLCSRIVQHAPACFLMIFTPCNREEEPVLPCVDLRECELWMNRRSQNKDSHLSTNPYQ